MAEVRLSRWLPHLEAAERQGVSLAAYAREQGLSRHTLYVARQLRNKADGQTQGKPGPKPSSAFAAVRIVGEGEPLRARLPNGVELAFTGSDYAGFIHALACAPCSR